MASSTTKSCFCLFVVAFCLSLNVEAREGKLFFSTFEPYGTHVEEGPSPSPAPAVSPAEGPSPATAPINPTRVGGGLRDGHFGPGSGMIPQTQESWPTTTTTTSTSDDDFDKLLNKFDGEKTNDKTDKLEEENYNTDRMSDNIEKENYQGEGYEKRNKYYNQRAQTRSKEYYYYDNTYNGHNNQEYNRYSPRRSSSNNYRSNNNYNEGMMREGDKEEEKEEEEEEERQGMSDTRFMENGRYFYDVKGENYENVPSRYGVEGEGYEKNDSERAHQKYPNEFDSMEEYYQSLEGPRHNFQP